LFFHIPVRLFLELGSEGGQEHPREVPHHYVTQRHKTAEDEYGHDDYHSRVEQLTSGRPRTFFQFRPHFA